KKVAPPPLQMPPTNAPRRTSGHDTRLLDKEAKQKAATPATKPRSRRRRGPKLRRFAIQLLLAGAGAGGYWYFALRTPRVPPPWAGLLDRAKQLVSRITSRRPAPPPPPPGPRRRTTADAPPAAPPPAAPPPAAAAHAPVPGPQP